MKGANKIFLWVIGTHISVLFLFFVIPWIQRCQVKPKEIVTFVEIATVAPTCPAIQSSVVPTKPNPMPNPVDKKVETTQSKWKPIKVKPQNRRVSNPNAKTESKPIDRNRLHQTLQNASETARSFEAYYNIVKRRTYAVWQQPIGEPVGTTATATIRVELTGTISKKSISRRSGNPAFDQAVQAALHALTRLPPPPSGFFDRNISIEFVLAK